MRTDFYKNLLGCTILLKIILAHFIPLSYIINHFVPQYKYPIPLQTVDNF